jgi:hypothetical protein
VDLYSIIESQRLSYVRHNQDSIRSGFLRGVEEAVGRGDFRPLLLGQGWSCRLGLQVEGGLCSIISRMQWLFERSMDILTYSLL